MSVSCCGTMFECVNEDCVNDATLHSAPEWMGGPCYFCKKSVMNGGKCASRKEIEMHKKRAGVVELAETTGLNPEI